MPRARFAQLPETRRAEIFAVAAEEFGKNGYHGTSYNALLARLGLGKSSAYYYFEDKADLFQAVVADRYRAFFCSVGEPAAPESPSEFWDFITEINRRGFDFMLDDPSSAALMQCLVREAASLDASLSSEQILNAMNEYHRKVLALGQVLGAVRKDLPLERLVLLSRALASTFDQAFVAEVRAVGAAAAGQRVRTTAEECTELLRRLLEPGQAQRFEGSSARTQPRSKAVVSDRKRKKAS
jgi:AcrR family transcriptional regulator